MKLPALLEASFVDKTQELVPPLTQW